MKKTFYIVVGMILLFSLVLSACGKTTPTTTKAPSTTAPAATTKTATTSAPSSTPAKQYGGKFSFIDPRGPARTIGWLAESGAAGGMFQGCMIENILDCDVFGKITPMLATEWKVAEDLSSITLKIRQGVKFHDGSDLTAEVVKWNIDQDIAAKLTSYAQWASVDLIDSSTIKINLKSYENTILNTLASTAIVSKAAYDKAGGGQAGADALRWSPVGTGPFKFVSFERDVSIKMAKFSDYWQKGKPYVDAVEFKIVADPMTRSAAFLAGEVDAVGGDLTKVEYDLAQRGYPVVSVVAGAVCMIGDSANPDSPFANAKVRQALDYAIDANAIVKARGFGWWEVVNQFCPPASPAYIKDLPTRSYNPEKAKQLLTEAGYPNGFKTKLIADSASTDKDAVTAMQGFLSKVGIEAELNYADSATYLSFRTGGWKNALVVGAVGFDANLNSSFARYYVQGASNYPSMLKTDEFQQLYLQSRQSKEYDPAKVQKMIRYLFDNALVTPLYAIKRGDVLQTYVHDTGFYTKQAWPGWNPSDVWLSKK